MTDAAATQADPTTRDLLGLAVGLAGSAGSVTLMFMAMRAVMRVGGACADGGAYQVAVHCPDGSAAGLTLGIFALLVSLFIAARYGPRVGGVWASAPVLGWAGLFVALGWNFLEAGFGGGDPVGWLLGVLFWAMGLIPLVAVLAPGPVGARLAGAFAPASGRGASTVHGVRPGPAGHGVPPRQPAFEMRTPAAEPSAPDADHEPSAEELLAHLERLADLRARGLLDAAEYETAKAAALTALERLR